MSQTYDNTFDAGEEVQVTMTNLMESSLEALRSCFSGPLAPGSPVDYMWWADTTNDILKFKITTGWVNVYDIATSEVILTDDQVTAIKIADAARKPSLILGEAIAPASCTIRTKFTGASLWNLPSELFDALPAVLGESDGTGWRDVFVGRVWIPADVDFIYYTFKVETCAARFVVGTETSATTGPFPGPSWLAENSLDLNSQTGIKTMKVQVETTQPGAPWGGIRGISGRFGE